MVRMSAMRLPVRLYTQSRRDIPTVVSWVRRLSWRREKRLRSSVCCPRSIRRFSKVVLPRFSRPTTINLMHWYGRFLYSTSYYIHHSHAHRVAQCFITVHHSPPPQMAARVALFCKYTQSAFSCIHTIVGEATHLYLTPPFVPPSPTHSLLVEELQVCDNVMADSAPAQQLHGGEDKGKPLHMHLSQFPQSTQFPWQVDDA